MKIRITKHGSVEKLTDCGWYNIGSYHKGHRSMNPEKSGDIKPSFSTGNWLNSETMLAVGKELHKKEQLDSEYETRNQQSE